MALIGSSGRPVALITIDSLRADHLGCSGYHRNTTPNIDALAARGLRFAQAVSNGGGTPEAFPSILGGQLPPSHWQQYAEIFRHRRSIAHILRDAGYETAAFHSNPYLSRQFSYHRGFETFDDGMVKLASNQRLVLDGDGFQRVGMVYQLTEKLRSTYQAWRPPIVAAEELTRRALTWLRCSSRPFFLWVHYMDVHYPYKPPLPYQRLLHVPIVNSWRMLNLYYKIRTNVEELSPSDLRTLVDLYDACIRYVDDVIGYMVAELRRRWPDAIIVLTADHGDAFGEHGRFGHDSVYEELIRVPLIVVGLRNGTGDVFGQVGLNNIGGLILSAIGLRASGWSGSSISLPSLVPQSGAETVISIALNPLRRQRLISCRTQEWKYILTQELNGGVVDRNCEFYDLRSDPHETCNLAVQEARKARHYRAVVDDYLSQVELKRNRTEAEIKRVSVRMERLKSSRRLPS